MQKDIKLIERNVRSELIGVGEKLDRPLTEEKMRCIAVEEVKKEAAKSIMEEIKWFGRKAADYAKQAADKTLDASKEGGNKAIREVKDTVKEFVEAWRIVHPKKKQESN